MSAVLEISNLSAGYGTSQVLFGIDLRIEPGEAVTLLGRNGMGKTTTVRCVAGLLRPIGGAIRLAGEPVAGRGADWIGRAGLGLVPEGRRIFPNLTARENLVAFAANRRTIADPWTLERVLHLFPPLARRLGHLGAATV